MNLRPVILSGVLLGAALLLGSARANAQCVDEELKKELVGKRAYRGVVPRKIKKALRHELSPLGGWYAGDISDGAPIWGGAYTFHFTEELGLEASYLHTTRSFGFIDAVNQAHENVLDIGNTSSPVNMYMGHLVWTLAYGKVRWFGGPIGRLDFYAALGGGAVDEAGSRGVAGSGGIGIKLFFTEWLGMRFDIRDQVRSVRGPLGIERVVNDVIALGGLSVFFPFSS
ncbi:MAG TPA: outer membrane beta-barrel domain-containing protein [Polyangiaceae bacterium]|nr:outer membrane beta-barrel domain-containing protein [Polyangiaceae bacterium]